MSSEENLSVSFIWSC